jgi:hypothetical protein
VERRGGGRRVERKEGRRKRWVRQEGEKSEGGKAVGSEKEEVSRKKCSKRVEE